MANHQGREGDSVDKTRGECSMHISGEPTSVAEQAANGGWSNQSPQGSTTPYDKGGTGDR